MMLEELAADATALQKQTDVAYQNHLIFAEAVRPALFEAFWLVLREGDHSETTYHHPVYVFGENGLLIREDFPFDAGDHILTISYQEQEVLRSKVIEARSEREGIVLFSIDQTQQWAGSLQRVAAKMKEQCSTLGQLEPLYDELQETTDGLVESLGLDKAHAAKLVDYAARCRSDVDYLRALRDPAAVLVPNHCDRRMQTLVQVVAYSPGNWEAELHASYARYHTRCLYCTPQPINNPPSEQAA
jgi:hypothetical protein